MALPLSRDVWSLVLEFCQLPVLCTFAHVNSDALEICIHHLAFARQSIDFRPRFKWSAELAIDLLRTSLQSSSSNWIKVFNSRRQFSSHFPLLNSSRNRVESIHFGWYCSLSSARTLQLNSDDHAAYEKGKVVRTEWDILSMLHRFHALTALSLGPAFSSALDEHGFISFMSPSNLGRRLTYLNLEGCVQLSAAFLDSTHAFSNRGLSFICPNLTHLNLAGTTVRHGDFPSTLTDLDVTLAHVRPNFMDSLSTLRLKRLVFVDPDLGRPQINLDDDFMRWLSNVQLANSIHCEAADQVVTLMVTLSQLSILEQLHDEFTDIDDEIELHPMFSMSADIVRDVHQRFVDCLQLQTEYTVVPSVLLNSFPWARLVHLCLNDQQLFGDSAMLALLALIGPQLVHLELENTNVGEHGIVGIGKVCSQLRVLNLGRLDISELAMQAVVIGCGSTLQDLVAFFASNFSSATLKCLTTHCARSLKHLNLRSCQANSEDLAALVASLPHLIHIDLCGTPFCPNDLVGILSQHPDRMILKLESLLITETCTDDQSLSNLMPFTPHLRRLDVYQCDGVSDIGLESVFIHCPLLHVLWVGGSQQLTDDFLLSLSTSRCRAVFEELHVCNELYESAANSDSELIYRGMHHSAYDDPDSLALRSQVLFEFEQNRSLRLSDRGFVALATNCPRLRVLDVTGLSGVTDQTMLALSLHSQSTLVSLTVDFCPAISLQGVISLLRHCSQLRHVSIFGCSGLGDGELALTSLRHTLKLCLSAQRILCLRADLPGVTAAGGVWPNHAWHQQWDRRDCKHYVLSGRRSFGWDLQEEANEDRKNL